MNINVSPRTTAAFQTPTPRQPNCLHQGLGRRFLRAWILPLPLLLLLTLPTSVHAQFTFTTNNGAITVTGYAGTNTGVTIPSLINGWPVTTIGDFAFYYCTSLTAITVRPLNARCRVL